MAKELKDFLTDDYCAGCDSFGHTERRYPEHPHLVWCNVCWEWRKEVPHSLRRAIEEVLDG